jgi:hypothetical protein
MDTKDGKFWSFRGGEKCLMDMVEAEGDGDLVSEEVLLPGLMWVWEEEAYQGVVIF